MPTYHTEIDRALPALPGDFQRYVQDLEALHTTADRFLRKRANIRDLRQAMRQAETSGIDAGRLRRARRSKAPASQPGQHQQPERECEYCGAFPAFRVIWIEERTGKRWSNFLCPDCDEREIRELNECPGNPLPGNPVIWTRKVYPAHIPPAHQVITGEPSNLD